MPVEVTDNVRIDRLVDQVKKEIQDGLSRELPIIRREIVERTRSGNDADGGSFASYSDAYAKAKAAALGSSTPVNLTVTGGMLDSMATRVVNNAEGVFGEITIEGSFNQDKAVWNQGGNPAIPARRFMALSTEQRDRILSIISNALDNALRS